jgi:FkbM family methyltransferase
VTAARAAAALVAAVWSHPANRSRRLAAVRRLVSWQVRKRVLSRPAVVSFEGLRFECAPDSRAASALIYFDGLPDYHEMRFVQRYLRRGDNFIDAGANVGVYTLLAASIVGEGRIDAFEPGPTAGLRRNVALNGLTNVAIHEVALAERPGDRAFAATDTSELAHLLPDGSDTAATVPCATLDGVLPPERRYAMAKLDVEGAEPLVLMGATRHLAARNPPVWQLELDGYSRRFGYATHEILSWLAALRYEPFVYDADQESLCRVEYPRRVGRTNALAIAIDRLDEVASRAGAVVV